MNPFAWIGIMKKSFEIVEQMDKEDTKSARVRERTVAWLSKERASLKALREKELENLQAEELLLKAENIHDRFVAADNSSKTRHHWVTA